MNLPLRIQTIALDGEINLWLWSFETEIFNSCALKKIIVVVAIAKREIHSNTSQTPHRDYRYAHKYSISNTHIYNVTSKFLFVQLSKCIFHCSRSDLHAMFHEDQLCVTCAFFVAHEKLFAECHLISNR